MGYSGITGASGKMLANLLHFGLVEKAGKGGVKVASLAVDILHPDPPESRKDAIAIAAFNPTLFAELRAKFTDGAVSENAIRSHLMRLNFSDAAVGPAISSFLETCAFVEQEGASKSHRPAPEDASDEPPKQPAKVPEMHRTPTPAPPQRQEAAPPAPPIGSRVVFSEEAGPDESLQVVAKGQMTDALLEALDDFVQRQRKRLAKG